MSFQRDTATRKMKLLNWRVMQDYSPNGGKISREHVSGGHEWQAVRKLTFFPWLKAAEVNSSKDRKSRR